MGQSDSKIRLPVPSLLDDSSKEFCTRMAFKLTPSYSSQLQARVKWLQVIESAKEDGWQANFDPADLTPSGVQRLAERIDKAFLHGSFVKVCRPRYLVKEELTGNVQGLSGTEVCNAVAGFEQDSNTLIVFRRGWQRQPSREKPVQSDGVYCYSRLEWLCHTLGHEMIHCIVHNACPKSRDNLAYATIMDTGPSLGDLIGISLVIQLPSTSTVGAVKEATDIPPSQDKTLEPLTRALFRWLECTSPASAYSTYIRSD